MRSMSNVKLKGKTRLRKWSDESVAAFKTCRHRLWWDVETGAEDTWSGRRFQREIITYIGGRKLGTTPVIVCSCIDGWYLVELYIWGKRLKYVYDTETEALRYVKHLRADMKKRPYTYNLVTELYIDVLL